MQTLPGTSGFSYKEWRGSFYPEQLSAKDMLRFYAERLPTVEINNTFYRLPSAAVLESWAGMVPDHFRFAIKASRRITHIKRLKNAGEELKLLLQATQGLRLHLGALLFQLPPNVAKDSAMLEIFMELLPADTPAVFEFRHPSWLDDDVYDLLRARNLALCVSDTDEAPVKTIVSTADWGYVRLRRTDYSESELKSWLAELQKTQWNKTFVFFKHEDSGTGPRFARRLLELSHGSP